MGTAGRSCIKSDKFVFSQQIEKFNWRVSRGRYLSPMYPCESTNCSWGLCMERTTVEENRESLFAKCLSFFASYLPFLATCLPQYCDYIEMSLLREDNKTEYLSVDVRLTVVDSFNIYSFYASKEINFASSFNREKLLRIRKSDLSRGCCWLNKMRFMPNDILTVKCEITVYETTEENYTNENELEDITKYVKKESIHWSLNLLGILFLILCVFYFGVQFVVILSFLVGVVFAFWYFGNPGGDRTYAKPEKSTEFQSQINKSDEDNLTYRSTKKETKDQLKGTITSKTSPLQNLNNRYENYQFK